MILGIITLPVALLSLVMGWKIWKNERTDLIHSYHQENVTDKPGYSRAMGLSLCWFGIAMVIIGIIAFLEAASIIVLGVVVFVISNVLVIAMIRIQIKYNGSIF